MPYPPSHELQDTARRVVRRNEEFPSCPHCKEGGELIVGKYVTISIYWDAENGYWHCLVCGFIGFGSDLGLLQYPIVACVGNAPRLPGTPRKRKNRARL